MAVSDPARFDYLFEPIDGDTESTGVGAVVAIDDGPSRTGTKRPWSWIAIVTATVVGVGIAMIALWTNPVEAVQSPPAVTTPAPASTSRPVVAPVSESAPAPAPTPEQAPTPEPTASVEPQPQPEPVVPPPPPAARPPAPIVRSPMSVSPVPRPAFPNQEIPDGNGGRGGLLGGGGLL